MPPEVGPMQANGGWTLILADAVALMLAFFVLSFSMREIIDDGPRPPGTEAVASGRQLAGVAAGEAAAADPGEGAPSAPAPIAGRSADQLQAPEQQAAGAPSFAYLAAILEREAGGPDAPAVRHDGTGLVVPLPGFAAVESRGPEPLPRPLLALAFLARRFDLALEVGIPADAAESLARRTERAMRLRDRLAAVTGLAAAEITFAAVPRTAAYGRPLAGDTGQGWAALQARAADAAASGRVRP